MNNIVISPHQWTHTGDRVLIVRCCDKDGKSHNGFQWPKSGKVHPEYCAADSSCVSGGLFGWPWGIGLGIGKDPEFDGVWIVFSAPKEQVIYIDGKVKVAANRPEDVDAEVVYFGSWHEAMERTRDGREAWIRYLTNQSASSATGDQSASSATGSRSASSATGYQSASSATGSQSASSATGDQSASSATGSRSASFATGDQSASSATGSRSASSATGYQSASSATGYQSASSATGDQSASSATGSQSASFATGDRSASSATGYQSVAAITGDESTIDCDPQGLGACTANIFYWKVRLGAIVVNRFQTKNGYVLKILDSIALGLVDGETVKVVSGEIIR